jgi:hypothetical protein
VRNSSLDLYLPKAILNLCFILSVVINNAIGGNYQTFFEDLQGALEAKGWQGRVKK